MKLKQTRKSEAHISREREEVNVPLQTGDKCDSDVAIFRRRSVVVS